MANGDDRVTLDSLCFTIGAVVYTAYPPGSFDLWPDEARLFVAELLDDAMERHGLRDEAPAVLRTMEELARPRFKRAVEEMEEVRKKHASEEFGPL